MPTELVTRSVPSSPPARLLPRLPLAALHLLACGFALSAGAGEPVAPELPPWVEAWDARQKQGAPAERKPTADEAPGLPPAPPPRGAPFVRPSDETLARLHRELADLQAQLAGLPKDEFGLPPADAAIYAEAVELQLKIDEWPPNKLDQSCFTSLRWGRAVAAGIKADPEFMRTVRHLAPVGYRSRVDRSAQPYMLLLPDDFDPDSSKPWRLIVTLHGGYAWSRPLGTIIGAVNRTGDVHPGAITVMPYGRGNTWYAWEGETDVWDVIADVKKRFRIDDNQIVLTGFSMGGGGSVLLGLTRPGAFAAVAPLSPAFYNFDPIPAARDLPAGPARWAPLPEDETARRVARVYAGPALAENGRGLPLLLGVGGADRLLKVQESLTQALDDAGAKYAAYVVPGVAHNGTAVAGQPEYLPFLMTHTRDTAPREVTFATATLRSPGRAWVMIEGLTAHYTKAVIHAVADPDHGTLTVTTDGIERFSLTPPESLAPRGRTAVSVDGEKFAAPLAALTFEKAGGQWRVATGPVAALSKHPGLQGPVADAFTRGFLCVRPTGTPWHEAVNRHAAALLEALRTNWLKRHYGDLPVKTDTEITAEDRARFDLILFGDPGSNRLIAEALAVKTPWALPLHWAKNTVGFGENKFAADTHLPALIYPSPWQTDRYVVINGVPLARGIPPARVLPTLDMHPLMPEAMGDFAIFQVDPATAGSTPAKSVHGGFFDEQWQ